MRLIVQFTAAQRKRPLTQPPYNVERGNRIYFVTSRNSFLLFAFVEGLGVFENFSAVGGVYYHCGGQVDGKDAAD